MSAIKPSIYSEMTITSSDGRSADFRLGAASVDIFEDLFSPSVSARIQIVNAGGAIRDDQGDIVSLYEGLKIRSGEIVRINIKANSDSNEDIDFTNKPLYVRSIQNLIRGTSEELFVLHLVSREAMENEYSFLKKTYPKDAPISDHVQSIIDEFFTNTTVGTIERTSLKMGFQGNQMKPYEALVRLASKAVSAKAGNSKGGSSSSAGFFFYQTRDGLQFRSLDSLCDQKPKATYVQTEYNPSSYDFQPTPDLPSLDYKIIDYTMIQNQDLVAQLRKGVYASARRFFDPINFSVTTTKDSFTGKDYIGGVKNLGQKFDASQIKFADLGRSFTELPSEILTEVFDFGTISGDDVEKDLTQDIFQFMSQRKMRYNTLFTQAIKMQVPLNSSLKAGDVINCQFPKITTSETNSFDRDQISGLYIIKELCHHFDTVGSYTIMTIVRDTFGRRKK